MSSFDKSSASGPFINACTNFWPTKPATVPTVSDTKGLPSLPTMARPIAEPNIWPIAL
jgi:hypothetical protein